MPTIRFTEENWPKTAAEFRQALQAAWHGRAPIDDLVQLVRDLTLLEQKHNMASAEFYQRYQRGEVGDDLEMMRWATKFEIYEEMKKDLDTTFLLKMAGIEKPKSNRRSFGGFKCSSSPFP